MTSALYRSEEQGAVRTPLILVEIDLDRCLNTYANDGTATASVSGEESPGPVSGSPTHFAGTLAHAGVAPGSFSFSIDTLTGADDGAGHVTGTGITSGTIDYATGAWDIVFAAGRSGIDILADYSYYTAPGSTCTATDLGDGRRCDYAFGGTSPCQDRAHYRKGVKTWRFINDVSNWLPEGVLAEWGDILPVIVSCTPIAQVIDQEAGFTQPEKLDVVCREIGSLAYSLEDGTTSEEYSCPAFNADKALRNTSRRGLFFRRLVAQNPNYKGRPIRVYRGFLTEDWMPTDFDLRWQGKLENIAFGADGNPTIHAVDMFQGVDTQIPPAVNSQVLQHLSRADTTLHLSNVAQFTDPATITGEVAIKMTSVYTNRAEVMTIVSVDVVAGTAVVVRARHGTHADPHDPGEAILEVLAYDDRHWVDVALDILDRCDVDVALIDEPQLRAQASWTGAQRLTRIVEQATAGRDLLKELVGDLYMGNLFASQTGKIRALVPNPGAVTSDGAGGATRETNTVIRDAPDILGKSGSANLNEAGRLTTVNVLFDPTPDGSDGTQGDGFNQIEVDVNVETLDDRFYGIPPAVKDIQSRWLDAAAETLAFLCGIRWLARLAKAPLRFQWQSDLRAGAMDVGDQVTILSGDIQDGNGDLRAVPGRIVGRKWSGLGAFEFIAQDTGYGALGAAGGGRYGYIGPDGMPDYGDASDAVRVYGFISGDDALMGNGDDGYFLA